MKWLKSMKYEPKDYDDEQFQKQWRKCLILWSRKDFDKIYKRGINIQSKVYDGKFNINPRNFGLIYFYPKKGGGSVLIDYNPIMGIKSEKNSGFMPILNNSIDDAFIAAYRFCTEKEDELWAKAEIKRNYPYEYDGPF